VKREVVMVAREEVEKGRRRVWCKNWAGKEGTVNVKYLRKKDGVCTCVGAIYYYALNRPLLFVIL
jgi:hypothetical protein